MLLNHPHIILGLVALLTSACATSQTVTEQPLAPDRTSSASLSINIGSGGDGQPTYAPVDAYTVPDDHEIGDLLIAFEGPGWESDLIGYRLYLDQRNAIDVFGKRTNDMVLSTIKTPGQHHTLDNWGMDVLKVGESVGAGGLAFWTGTETAPFGQTKELSTTIDNSAENAVIVTVTHQGFESAIGFDQITTQYKIKEGQRHFNVTATGMPQDNGPILATGIVRLDTNELVFKKPTGKAWGYVAGYIDESLSGHGLGIATLVPAENFSAFELDDNSAVILLSSQGGQVNYSATAAWALEKNGITSKAGFFKYVEDLATQLEVGEE